MIELGLGGLFGAISACYVFTDFLITLSEVASENEVFIRTIQRVRLDLAETERLLRLAPVCLRLSKVPAQIEYISSVVTTTKVALNEMYLYVEAVRADKERDGKVGFANKVRWALKDHPKLENRRAELAASHQSLTTMLNMLHLLEHQSVSANEPDIVAAQELIDPPTYNAVNDDDFLSPSQIHRRKSKPPQFLSTPAEPCSEEKSRISSDSTVRPVSPAGSYATASSFSFDMNNVHNYGQGLSVVSSTVACSTQELSIRSNGTTMSTSGYYSNGKSMHDTGFGNMVELDAEKNTSHTTQKDFYTTVDTCGSSKTIDARLAYPCIELPAETPTQANLSQPLFYQTGANTALCTTSTTSTTYSSQGNPVVPHWQNAFSPAVSSVSLEVSEHGDRGNRNLEPNRTEVNPSLSRTSHSRRRRAMMEAAVGGDNVT